ncbi:MAG: DegT/DnrJ/EryC1/StrS family aminotransferase [Nitrospirota bacterium]
MKWKIKFFDYPLQFSKYEKEYIEVIQDTLSRGAYILGEDLKRFEKNLAEYMECKFAIGVSNCTDAILLSLIAGGVGHGDEVISVSHTVVATIEVIKFLEAKPVFVDIAEDHNMNIELIENAITTKTKAILPVHLNGRICSNMDKLLNIAEKYNLIIIEDAAQSLGATYKKKYAGTFGLAGCFSFYPAKLLGAFGDAGAVVTDNEEFAEKIRLLRNHGRGKENNVNLWGLNCRMDNLHAAILDFKLNKLNSWIKRRREIAHIYHTELSFLNELRLPSSPDEDGDYYDVFQNYEIEAERRDELVKYLNQNRIEVMLPWGGKCVHQFKALGFNNIYLPRTEEFFRKCLMLPIYPELKNEHVEYVSSVIKAFYNAK